MTTRFLQKLYQTRFAATADKVFRDNFNRSVRRRNVTTPYVQPTDLFRLDPPGIFCGRDAQHPLRGTCKFGVTVHDVIINVSNVTAEQREQLRKAGFRRFERVPHTRWMASWTDEVTGERRYVFPKVNDSDVMDKFETARKLHRNLSKVRRRLTCPSMIVLLYFIEHLCIRIGNEKDTQVQANTVGCCTLLAHTHVRVVDAKTQRVHLRFHGKDSIVYDQKIKLPQNVFDHLNRMLRDKVTGDKLFDVRPSAVNRVLSQCVPGCTAKTFRTMRASTVFERVLRKTDDPRAANEAVARLLNHQNKRSLNMETSRKNYIDPRIYFAYCKRAQIPPRWFLDHEKWAGKVSKEFCF